MWAINSSSYINMKFARNWDTKKSLDLRRELCDMQVILHQQQGTANVPNNGEALKMWDARRLCAVQAGYTMHFINRVVSSCIVGGTGLLHSIVGL
jgi:hypothetical protein